MRKLSIWLTIALLSVVGFAIYRVEANASAKAWDALAIRRERALWMRHLPALETFIQGQFDFLRRTAYPGVPMARFRENQSWARGILLGNSGDIGTIFATYYFDSSSLDPRSLECVLTLDKEAAKKSLELTNEFGSLLREAQRKGELRTTYKATETFLKFEKGGDCLVTFRTTLPSNYMPWIAEYDRGTADAFEFEVLPRYLQFMREQVFKDQYQRFYRHLPTFNPPSHVLRNGLGTTSGLIILKGGKVLGVTISVSGSVGSFRRMVDRAVMLRIEDHSFPRVTRGELEGVFNQKFLAQIVPDGQATEGPVQISGNIGESGSYFTVISDIDYPIQYHQL